MRFLLIVLIAISTGCAPSEHERHFDCYVQTLLPNGDMRVTTFYLRDKTHSASVDELMHAAVTNRKLFPYPVPSPLSYQCNEQ